MNRPYFTSSPVHFAANAHRSAVSSMILSVGLPEPWPARVSMRIRCGFGPMSLAFARAAGLGNPARAGSYGVGVGRGRQTLHGTLRVGA